MKIVGHGKLFSANARANSKSLCLIQNNTPRKMAASSKLMMRRFSALTELACGSAKAERAERKLAMKALIFFLTGAVIMGAQVLPSAAADVPKFGKTCVGKSGWNTDVCISSNGKSLSSTYKWKGTVSTRGTHTGCSTNGSTISCKGGTFATASGSGKMDPIRVKVVGGKPVSLAWN